MKNNFINQTTLVKGINAELSPVPETEKLMMDILIQKSKTYSMLLKENSKYISEFFNDEVNNLLVTKTDVIKDAYNAYTSQTMDKLTKDVFYNYISKHLFTDHIFKPTLPNLNEDDLREYAYFRNHADALNKLTQTKKGDYNVLLNSYKPMFGTTEKSIGGRILSNIFIQLDNIKLYQSLKDVISELFTDELNTLFYALSDKFITEYQSLDILFDESYICKRFLIQSDIDIYNAIINSGFEYNGEYYKSLNTLIREYNQNKTKKDKLKLFSTLDNQITFNTGDITETVYKFNIHEPEQLLNTYVTALSKYDELFCEANTKILELLKSGDYFVNIDSLKYISTELSNEIINSFVYTSSKNKRGDNIKLIREHNEISMSIKEVEKIDSGYDINALDNDAILNYFNEYLDFYGEFQLNLLNLQRLAKYEYKSKINIVKNYKYAKPIKTVNDSISKILKYISMFLVNLDNEVELTAIKTLYNECKIAMSESVDKAKKETARLHDCVTFNDSKHINKLKSHKFIPMLYGSDVYYMVIYENAVHKYITERYTDKSFVRDSNTEYYCFIGTVSTNLKGIYKIYEVGSNDERKVNAITTELAKIGVSVNTTDVKELETIYNASDTYSKIYIEKDYIDGYVKNGGVGLFKVNITRDNTKNRKMFDYLFSEENLFNTRYMLLRKPTINMIPKRNDKPNSRYSRTYYTINIPCAMNPTARKMSQKSLNEKVINEIMSSKDDLHIIALDRGENNLVYMSVVNAKTNTIVEEQSLNVLGNQNYYDLIVNEKSSIANAETYNTAKVHRLNTNKNFIERAVNKITETFMKYPNAVIVFENLNSAFKHNGSGNSKNPNIYQSVEMELIKRLSCMWNKHIEPGLPGSVNKPYTFTMFESVEKCQNAAKFNKQNGVIFYVNPSYTSSVDPHTGFINVVKYMFETIKKSVKIVSNGIESITLTDDTCEIVLDEREFPVSNNKFNDYREKRKFIIHKNEKRCRQIRVNNKWCSEEVKPHKIIREIFDSCGLSDRTTGVELCNKFGKNEELYKSLFGVLSMMTKVRHKIDKKDLICSCVVGDDGKRVQDYGDLNGDLNGANNIALKFISDIYDTITEQSKLETPVYKFDTNLNRYLNKVKNCKLKRTTQS